MNKNKLNALDQIERRIKNKYNVDLFEFNYENLEIRITLCNIFKNPFIFVYKFTFDEFKYLSDYDKYMVNKISHLLEFQLKNELMKNILK